MPPSNPRVTIVVAEATRPSFSEASTGLVASAATLILKPDEAPAKRAGYVLLMVIALLVILITALSMLATKSLRVSSQAANAAVRLQQRWGMASLKKAILPHAEPIFVAFEKSNLRKRGETSPNMLADQVILGEQRFDLALSDESSKLNLNAVYRKSGTQGVSKAIQESAGPNAAVAIDLRPAMGASTSSSPTTTSSGSRRLGSGGSPDESSVGSATDLGAPPEKPAFRSWGEVFDLSKVVAGPKGGTLQFDFMRSLTLWGNGQININRTRDEAALKAMELAVPAATAKSLLKSIRGESEVDLQALVEQKVDTEKDRRSILGLVSTSSFNFSLFIDVQSPRGGSRRLFVAEQTFSGQVVSEFVFH